MKRPPTLRPAALAVFTRGWLWTLCLASALVWPATRAAAPKPNEITVSAANYAQTPPDVLARMFRQPADLPDAPPPPPVGDRPVRYYQFLPGETLDADLPYLEVCKLLVPALAAKNLRNTFDQSKVDLILRVTFGARRWRDPFVRKDHLQWRHGLVPKRRGTSLGATNTWDDRAGGDEAALHQLERDLTELNPTGGADGLADRLIGGQSTEEHFLIVVDAFEVATLRQKGNATPRAWTTFIAVKRPAGAKFADLAAAMIEKAAPWFGETLPGKARFTDRDGTVTAGELRVIEPTVPRPRK